MIEQTASLVLCIINERIKILYKIGFNYSPCAVYNYATRKFERLEYDWMDRNMNIIEEFKEGTYQDIESLIFNKYPELFL